MNNTLLKDNDGFSYVSYKRKRKKKNLKQPFLSSQAGLLKNFDAVINNIQDELKCSDFFTQVKEDLSNFLHEWDLRHLVSQLLDTETSNVNENCIDNNKEQELDIICYGLGQFSSCVIARYQLGFLLILKEILQCSQVYIYDPKFSIEEIDFLKKLGLNVISINERAKRTLNRKTICFMPHCDLPLYNNLLWTNWNMKNLLHLALIGNSFQSYETNDAKGHLKEKSKYVYLANQFVTEVRIRNDFHYSDIFNDLSVHYFKTTALSIVEPKVWTDLEEPQYSDDDIC